MMIAMNIPLKFWAEAVHTACYIINRVFIRIGIEKTCYKLWNVRMSTTKYFHIFGNMCYILNDREYRQNLDPKSDEMVFLGYSTNNKAYKVFNNRTKPVMESINVTIKDVERNIDTEDEETLDTTSWSNNCFRGGS